MERGGKREWPRAVTLGGVARRLYRKEVVCKRTFGVVRLDSDGTEALFCV